MPTSLRAHFLMAVKGLRDPNFFKSVVLMVEDGENGSMGLVLNRPSNLRVREVLEGHFDLPDVGDLVYSGGPVDPTALFILHNAGDADPGERELLPGLFVGSSAIAFQDVVQRIADGDDSLRFPGLCRVGSPPIAGGTGAGRLADGPGHGRTCIRRRTL